MKKYSRLLSAAVLIGALKVKDTSDLIFRTIPVLLYLQRMSLYILVCLAP